MTDVAVAVIGLTGLVVTTAGAIIGVLLRALLKRVEGVHSEVTPNGGASSYDRLTARIDGLVDSLPNKIAAAIVRHEQSYHRNKQ